MAEEDNRANVQPIPATVFALNDLLARMTSETFPDDEDFGPAVGDEIW
jgi:hypothetical protein